MITLVRLRFFVVQLQLLTSCLSTILLSSQRQGGGLAAAFQPPPVLLVPPLLPVLPSLPLVPFFGIGAVLFPVNRVTQRISKLTDKSQRREALLDASEFFVDSFWTAKVGGGAKTLTKRQRQSLLQSQQAEFNKRYGSISSTTTSGRNQKADLILCRNKQQQIIACAGVEVDAIRDGSLTGPVIKRAPLMSNLAVSRQYRRRGLAEALVKAVEVECRSNEWGSFNECYLYVEKCNPAAIQLYRKLGYRPLWQDATARTLSPDSSGGLRTRSTVIVCMRKRLSGGGSFLPFWQSFFS